MEIEQQIDFLKKKAHGVPFRNRSYCTKGIFKGYFVFKSVCPLDKTDLEEFEIWHRGESTDDYQLCYIPNVGYRYIRKTDMDDTVLFILGAEKRRGLLWRLASGEENTFNKYLHLWETNSQEMEYHLWLYDNDAANPEWYKQTLREMMITKTKGEKQYDLLHFRRY